MVELEAKAKASRALAAAYDEEAEQVRRLVMFELNAQGLKSFKGTLGTASISKRYHVKMPQDFALKTELKDYLLQRGQFEALWTINYQSLNSYFKQEAEAADAEGRYLDIPGLNPVSEPYLSFRKITK